MIELEGLLNKDKQDLQKFLSPGVSMIDVSEGNPVGRILKLTSDLKFLTWTNGWVAATFFGAAQKVDLERITLVLRGQHTSQFYIYNNETSSFCDRSMTLMYMNRESQRKSLNLIASSSEELNYFIEKIQFLKSIIDEQKKRYNIDSLFYQSLWSKIGKVNKNSLNIKELQKLQSVINVDLLSLSNKNHFENMKRLTNRSALDYEIFCNFMNLISRRRDIEAIWTCIIEQKSFKDVEKPLQIEDENTSFAQLNATITLNQFIAFYAEVNKEELSLEDAFNILKTCNQQLQNPDDKNQDEKITKKLYISINFEIFSNFFKNHIFLDAFNPKKKMTNQDMDKPLTQFFIASSHNTYLEGDQWTSFSSVLRYIEVLSDGLKS